MQRKKLSLFCFMFATVLFFLLIFPFSSPAQQTPANQIDIANQAFNEGKYEDAIKIYTSILQDNPDNIVARARLARSFYLAANKNPEYLYQAAMEYNKLLQQVPNFSLSYLELGQITYLLGLKSWIDGRERHAQGLYESVLDWFAKYIRLEAKGEALENQMQLPITKVLQAIIYSRMEEKDKAFQLVAEAKKEYAVLSAQTKDFPSLYDYFVRSGIEYESEALHSQALIYLEGAWLIESRPQIRTLLENVIKNKGMPIPILQPFPRAGEEITPQEIMEQEIEKLYLHLDSLEKKLAPLPTLTEEVDGLKRKVKELLDLELEVNKIRDALYSLSYVEGGRQDEQTIEEYSTQILKLKESVAFLSEKIEPLPEISQQIKQLEAQIKAPSEIDAQKLQEYMTETSKINHQLAELEKKVEQLDKTITEIKSLADIFGILNIQIRELRNRVEELESKMPREQD